LRFGNDLVRIAAVANGISEVHDEVVGGRGGYTSVERL
jgi:hypothetical protein